MTQRQIAEFDKHNLSFAKCVRVVKVRRKHPFPQLLVAVRTSVYLILYCLYLLK